MFQPVKIGVIGLGRFGRLHALTSLGLAETQLVAVVARRQVSLERLAPELPGVRGFTDLAQAMSQSGAEAWIVACSTHSHVGVTRSLLEAGYPVLLEKPISDSLAEARTLDSLVHSDSRNLMLGHIVLFNSEFQQLRDEVRGRGPIAYLDAVRHRPASIVSQFPGENPLHAAMVHDLYMAQALVGRSDPVQFSAQYHRTASGQIDLALAQMIWPGGTVGSFAASYLTPAGMPPRGIDRMEVFGDGWAARITPNPRPFEMWDERATWPMTLEIRTGDSGPTGMMAEEQRCFARVVRGLSPVPPGATYHDALQVQHWMETLTRCAEQSACIRLPSG